MPQFTCDAVKQVWHHSLTCQCCTVRTRSCVSGDFVSGAVSLRIQQLDVACETKTKDNVFVNVVVSVQYQVRPLNHDGFGGTEGH